MHLTERRKVANAAAQDALHRLVTHKLATGQWDRHLAAEWHAAEAQVDMLDDLIRDMMADTAEPDGMGLPDIALADPGDHYAGVGR